MNPGSRPPATMKDVAALAQVSVPTVSRYVNGGRVSPEKREAIASAVLELGFIPNISARALMGQRPPVIGIIAGNTSHLGYAETIRGIEEAARADGHTVTITVVEDADDQTVSTAISLLRSTPIAGVIVLKFDRPGVAVLGQLPPALPVVALSGAKVEDRPQAVIREAEAARHLVEHLLDLGHETVHHVRIPRSRREDSRSVGWRSGLRAAGRAIPEPWDVTWDPRDAVAIGHEIAARPDVTAVLCGNDESAMGVIAGLRQKGLRVPDDVSVTGFDDHPLSLLWDPPLTTVRQDFAELGRRGWALLKESMAGSTAHPTVSLPAPLVIRASTAAPRRRG